MNKIPDGYIGLSEINLWKDNYNEGDVGAIAESIDRFGFGGALRLWQDNVAIDGNHTAMALMGLKARGPVSGRPYPPANIIEKGGEWFVRFVPMMHLDELEARAFAIADNDIARKAVQHDALKAQFLIEIAQKRPDILSATGTSPEDLDELLARLAKLNKEAPPVITAMPPNEKPADMIERFTTGEIKQIVLYFEAAAYAEIVETLTALREAAALVSNSNAVEYLLAEWRAAHPEAFREKAES